MIEVQNNLHDTSRVWVYQSNRAFTNDEMEILLPLLSDFNNNWVAHSKKLNSAIEVFYNQFIVLFVDEYSQEATGCSIDSSVSLIKDIEEKFAVSLLDRLNLTYKQNNEIKTIKMANFQEAIKAGEITNETTVYNNLIITKNEFINNWEVPAKLSWHANLF